MVLVMVVVLRMHVGGGVGRNKKNRHAGAYELSEASRITLGFQGGPMNADDAAAFEAEPLFTTALRLRTCVGDRACVC